MKTVVECLLKLYRVYMARFGGAEKGRAFRAL